MTKSRGNYTHLKYWKKNSIKDYILEIDWESEEEKE